MKSFLFNKTEYLINRTLSQKYLKPINHRQLKSINIRLICLTLFLSTTAYAQQAKDDLTWLPEVTTVPAGQFLSGSLREEKEKAYQLDENAYGHSVTRNQGWYEFELARQNRYLPEYSIMKTPVTRCDYARFVKDTSHQVPVIDQGNWEAQRLKHTYQSTIKFQWKDAQQNNHRRCRHPVVLVTHADATAYAEWLSLTSGQSWRLPTELEWEKAARGVSGNLFPWGNEYEASKLNSHDNGPFDTIPVGSFPEGASPFGMLDAAGQVFEWTSNKHPERQRYIVKGGSWDDYRDEKIKHILVGFRLVKE